MVSATTPDPLADRPTETTAIPGLHILANFSVDVDDLLRDYAAFQRFIDGQVRHFCLSKVGEVYHNFPSGGFTAVVCLTESHLSVHTWPELKFVTFDVFLSNYMKDNRHTTRALYAAVTRFFGGRVVMEQMVER